MRELIQNVFPHLNAGQREFIMTGITDDEWEAAFKRDAYNRKSRRYPLHEDTPSIDYNGFDKPSTY